MLNSIFHQIQKEGAKSLELVGLNPGFELDPTLFVEKKLANHYHDPLPIFVFHADTAKDIGTRAAHIRAMDGLSADEHYSTNDQIAYQQLLFEDQFKGRIPARRFCVEFHREDGGVTGILIEAIKTNGPRYDNEVAYTTQEASNRKISDCNFFRVCSFNRDEEAHGSKNIFLDFWSPLLFTHETQESGKPKFSLSPLSSNYFEISRAPTIYDSNQKISWPNICQRPNEWELEQIGQITKKLLSATFDILWVLEREPQIVTRNSPDFTAENRWRRARKQSAFSPVHVIDIDQTELRRVEFRRAAEIAETIKEHGRYSIPGLVLVEGYDKPSTGQFIEDYARCANETVRREATRLFRAKDFENLAVLMKEWGNETTLERMQSSPVFVPRLIQTTPGQK